jgi:hypothetical protein
MLEICWSSNNSLVCQNNEDPVLILKKHGKDMSRKGSFDSGIGMQVLLALIKP